MTNILTYSEYYLIRTALREKYFNKEGFTKINDIDEFNRHLNDTPRNHIGQLSESIFLAHYLINPGYKNIIDTYATTELILKAMLSQPTKYINSKSNISTVYEYLDELNQCKTNDNYLTNRFQRVFDLFTEYKQTLLSNTTPNNNQQVWI